MLAASLSAQSVIGTGIEIDPLPNPGPMPQLNPCATNVNAKVNVSKGVILPVAGGVFRQIVTIQNTSATNISGSVALVFESLSDGNSVNNRDGLTRCGVTQDTKSFVYVDTGADNVLGPGQSASVSVYYKRAGQAAPITFSAVVRAGAQLRPMTVQGDYDGDGRADLSLLNPQSGTFTVRRSSDDQVITHSMPTGQIVPVPGDYDGDRITDYATFEKGTNMRRIRLSKTGADSVSSFAPNVTRYPAPGDYDGDGKTDWAEYRPNDGNFSVSLSSTGTSTAKNMSIANPNDYRPVSGLDADGNGKLNYTLLANIGFWRILNENGTFGTILMPIGGAPNKFIPLGADHDGDGIGDRAYYNTFSGHFTVALSKSGQTNTYVSVGQANHLSLPATADFDGDGKADVATFTPSTGMWRIFRSTGGVLDVSFTDGSGNQLPATRPFHIE